MSVSADAEALLTVRQEIKTLGAKQKKLRDIEKNLQIRIQEFMKANNLPGVKYRGLEIKLEQQEKPGPKKNTERDKDACAVLQSRFQIDDSESRKVLEELMMARKGDPVTQEKLKIAAPKKKKVKE